MHPAYSAKVYMLVPIDICVLSVKMSPFQVSCVSHIPTCELKVEDKMLSWTIHSPSLAHASALIDPIRQIDHTKQSDDIKL